MRVKLPSQTSDLEAAPDQIPAVLSRIERYLARIAEALEAMVVAPADIQKDLGPTRTMPKPRHQ